MSVKHVIKVRNRYVESLDKGVIANGVNSDEIVLDLDSEWDGLTLTIFLGCGDTLLKTDYKDGSPCYIPSSLLRNPGDRISFSLVGENDDQSTRLVTSRCMFAFNVLPSGSFNTNGRRC